MARARGGILFAALALASVAACGDAAAPASPAGAPTAYVDADVNHVLVTGQSNAVSNRGIPVLTTTQPFGNLMFDTGLMPMNGGFSDPANHASARIPGCDVQGCTAYETPTALVPLVEGDRFFDYAVETPAAGLANEISELATTRFALVKHDVLVSIHGRSGNTYQCLRKAGCNYKTGYLSPFEQGMKEVASAKALAAAQGKSYAVRAVVAIHGESDHESYTLGTQEFPLLRTDGQPGVIADYGGALLEWQRDYEAGVQAITGQTLPVPLLVTQISGWRDAVSSRVAQFQLDAHAFGHGKVILVGPSYPLSLDQSDCLHFTDHGARRLGEYVAKVYARVVFEGKPWEPLRPRTIERSGASLRVTFYVPEPPLVFDTIHVAPAPADGFSFVESDGTPGPAITDVELTAPDAVTLTFASPPPAGGYLRYGMNQVPGACIGTPNGARGNLRDSDATPSRDGYDLTNWAVQFDVSVP